MENRGKEGERGFRHLQTKGKLVGLAYSKWVAQPEASSRGNDTRCLDVESQLPSNYPVTLLVGHWWLKYGCLGIGCAGCWIRLICKSAQVICTLLPLDAAVTMRLKKNAQHYMSKILRLLRKIIADIFKILVLMLKIEIILKLFYIGSFRIF